MFNKKKEKTDSKFIYHIEDITKLLLRKYDLIKSINPHEIYSIEVIDGIVKDLIDISVKMKNKTKETQDIIKKKEELRNLEIKEIKHELEHLRSISDVKGFISDWRTLSFEEQEDLKICCSIYHYLVEMSESNQFQKKIFEEYQKIDFTDWVEKDYKLLYKCLAYEFKNYMVLIEAFDIYIELSEDERNMMQEIIDEYEGYRKDRHVKKLLKEIEEDKDSMALDGNEVNAKDLAETIGVDILESDSPEKVLLQIGRHYNHLVNGDFYDVYWDTIPIVRKEVKLVLDYIDKNYNKAWKIFFGDKVVDVVKFHIGEASRTRKGHDELFKKNLAVNSAEKSLHVRGLAIDITLLKYLEEFEKKDIDISLFGSKEELIERISEMFDYILKELKSTKYKGAPLVTSYLKSNGDYYIGVCPKIDAIRDIVDIE